MAEICDKIKKEELQKMLHCSATSIEHLVRDKIISRNKYGGKITYDRNEVLKALGIDIPVNEPFITHQDAADILGISPANLVPACRSRGIPYYSLRSGVKGTRYLFLRSDFDVYKKIEAKYDFGKLLSRYLILSKVSGFIMDSSLVSDLTEREKEVLSYSFRLGKYDRKYLSKDSKNESYHLHRALEKIIKNSDYAKQIPNLKSENEYLKKMNADLKNKIDILLKYRDAPSFNNVHPEIETKSDMGTVNIDPKDLLIENFDLSPRVITLINEIGVKTLGELSCIRKSYIIKYRNVGAVTLDFLDKILSDYGLTWEKETEKLKL